MFDGDQAYWRRMECMTTKVCQNAIDKYGDLNKPLKRNL